MTSRSEAAATQFSEGYNCAQSVLSSFCDELGLDHDTALRIACGFGAGMGRKGNVCGAVTGGIAVLGMKYGRGEKEDRTATHLTYRKTREFIDRFIDRHGSCGCRELLKGCDLTTEEGQQQFKAQDFHNRVCKPCVRTAVEIIEDITREDR
jgi:C_GCAxxG_C_C family probable redox protein